MLIHDILNTDVKPKGDNFGISLRKIINACRVLLEQKPIVMMEDDALMVTENPRLMDDFLNEMPNSTIISVVNNFENLLYFDEVIVLDGGFVVEKGDPSKLIVDRSSSLFTTVRKVDKTLSKLIEDSLEKGLTDKEIHEEYFKIPSWFIKYGYNVKGIDRVNTNNKIETVFSSISSIPNESIPDFSPCKVKNFTPTNI